MKKFFNKLDERFSFIINNITTDELIRILFMYFIFVLSFNAFYACLNSYIISNIASISVSVFLFFDIFINEDWSKNEKRVFKLPELVGTILGIISVIPMIFI